MKEYNKLIRDNIPAIIASTGKHAEIEVLEDNTIIAALKNKLEEEVKEVIEASDREEVLEELADVLEIVDSLAREHGWNLEDVLKKKEEKRALRGGFEKRLFLKHVE
ncbi:MAG: MazG-like family protein [Candidatus Gracilibacteria bacterium]